MITLENLKPLLDWIQTNPNFAGFFVFLISFLESLAFVGLLIPGAIVMPAIGTLIGSQILPALPIFGWAAAGSVLGDFLSYWLGYHFKDHIREMWPFNKLPNMLNSGVTFFKKHGGKSVVLGRYIGIMRPITPLIAGMMSMLPSRFLLASLLASITWAPLYMFPGILIGAASVHLAPHIATRLTLFVLMLALVAILTGWLFKRIFQAMIFYLHQFLHALWIKIRRKPSLFALIRFFENPSRPEHPAQGFLLFYFIVSLIAFSVLLHYLETAFFIANINHAVLHLLRSIRTDTAYKWMLVISQLGGTSLFVMAFFVIVFLSMQRAWRAVIHFIGSGFFIVATLYIIKHWVAFPRPRGLIASPSDWAFPSGHVSASVALLGFLSVLLANGWPKHRKVIFFFLVLFVLLVAASRLYLGVHWASDVVGGMLLGSAVCLFVTLSYYRGPPSSVNPLSLVLVMLLGWSLGVSAWLIKGGYHRDIENYSLAFPTHVVATEEWWNQLLPEDLLLMRTDRFGHATEVLNVQWAGHIPTIENYLLQQHWNKVPKSDFQNIITRIASYKNEDRLPLLPKMYLDKKPSLLVSKIIDNETLLLRLWKTPTLLMPTQTPLWAGTVEYYPALPITSSHPLAIKQFEKDLESLDWKEITYPCPHQAQSITCDGHVVLIK